LPEVGTLPAPLLTATVRPATEAIARGPSWTFEADATSAPGDVLGALADLLLALTTTPDVREVST
jgi:hypothetical protein